MLDKFKNVDFGRCPRVLCEGQPCLPVGTSDIPGQSTVKVRPVWGGMIMYKSRWGGMGTSDIPGQSTVKVRLLGWGVSQGVEQRSGRASGDVWLCTGQCTVKVGPVGMSEGIQGSALSR
jgi:hypothetical protein